MSVTATPPAVLPDSKDVKLLLEAAAIVNAAVKVSTDKAYLYGTSQHYLVKLTTPKSVYRVYLDRHGRFVEATGGSPYERYYRRQVAYLRESLSDTRHWFFKALLESCNTPQPARDALLAKL